MALWSWVLDEYGLSDMSYQLSKLGASLAKEVCNNFNKDNELKLILGSIGPGTKLPSLGHIDYDDMYNGYLKVAEGLIDGGVDIFLLETCQGPSSD